MSVFDEFKWRGMLHSASEGAAQALTNEKLTAYIGFDPSAASLHVGSLLQIMALARLQRYGHSPIAIVGGGTGLIGDPSGKAQERQLLTKEKVEENLQGIKSQLVRFLDFEAKSNPAQVVNNADWLTTIGLTDFLRDIGKFFTVNNMLAKDSVSRRMEEGISFTEFSYMLLQAYDFLVLYDRYNCKLQLGGSDQWGNIVAGTDLIRRMRSDQTWQPTEEEKEKPPLAYGIVFYLVTSAEGTKFGKTEAGTIWLDAELTSPFRFYQFWLNTDDRDVDRYLKFFTWLTQPEIAELASSRETAPQQRLSQIRLAQEVTRAVHGDTALAAAERASRMLFGDEEIADLQPKDVEDIFGDVPTSEIAKDQLAGEGIPLADLLVLSGLVPSKAEGRRSMQAGGIYLNNQRVADEKRQISINDTIGGRFLLLRKGRKTYHLIRVHGA